METEFSFLETFLGNFKEIWPNSKALQVDLFVLYYIAQGLYRAMYWRSIDRSLGAIKCPSSRSRSSPSSRRPIVGSWPIVVTCVAEADALATL